jgi:hypothetical protein
MRRHVARSPLSRYGVAILSVTATVGFALWLRPAVMAASQLSLVAVVITGPNGPLGAVLNVALPVATGDPRSISPRP